MNSLSDKWLQCWTKWIHFMWQTLVSHCQILFPTVSFTHSSWQWFKQWHYYIQIKSSQLIRSESITKTQIEMFCFFRKDPIPFPCLRRVPDSAGTTPQCTCKTHSEWHSAPSSTAQLQTADKWLNGEGWVLNWFCRAAGEEWRFSLKPLAAVSCDACFTP